MNQHERRFRPDIEGLRAIAVLLVLLFHAGVPFLPGGFIGVDVFFVVSGFLITGILVRETASRHRISLTGFYSRRVRRILPMATLVLIAVAIGSVFILPSSQLGTIKTSIIGASLFVSNWVFASQSVDYFAPDVASNPVLHFWSLSVEEQFYVVWPLLIIGTMWLIRRNRRLAKHRLKLLGIVLLLLTGISLALSIIQSKGQGDIAYFSLQTRVWELGIGGLLAISIRQLALLTTAVRWLTGWIGLALILYAGFFFSAETVFPGAAALIPVGGSALVIMAGIRDKPIGWSVASLLSLKPMQYIGARSYNLYLWHWPLLVFAGTLASRQLTSENIDSAGIAPPLAAAIAVALALLLTIITFRIVEQPLRSAKFMRTPKSSLPTGALLISLTLIIAAFGMPALANAYSSSRGGNQTIINQIKELATPANLDAQEFSTQQSACRADQNETAQESLARAKSSNCIFGDKNGTKTIALIGDSHADMWLWGLDTAGKKNGWKILSFARTNCPYMALGTTELEDTNIESNCPEWAKLVYDEVLQPAAPFDAILLARTSRTTKRYVQPKFSEEYQSSLQESFTNAITRSFNEYGKLTNNLLVLADPPRADFDIPDCLEQNSDNPQACNFNRTAGLSDENQLLAIEKEAAAQSNVSNEITFLPIGDLLCKPNQEYCEVLTPNGLIAYRDSNHINFAAAREYANQIADLLKTKGHLN